MPQARAKKATGNQFTNNKLVRLITQNKIWAFIFVFGFIGIAGVAASFASDPNAILTGKEDIVFEYRNADHDEAYIEVDAQNIATHEEDVILLLGDGRFFCSDDSPTNPVGYNEGRLSKAAVKKLATDIKATGFQTLKDVYSPSGAAMSHMGETFTLQMAGGPKTVRLQQIDTPAALVKAREIMNNLCSGNVAQYYPDKAEVVTTKITAQRVEQLKTVDASVANKQSVDGLAARTDGIMNELLANTKAQQLQKSQSKTLDKLTARKLLDELKTRPTKVVTDGAQDIEVDVKAALPKYKPAVVVPKSKSLIGRLAGSVFGVPKVEAQGAKTVEIHWFYAADEAVDANWQSRLKAIADETRHFYQTRTGKTMNVVVAPQPLRGERTLAQYGARWVNSEGKASQGDVYAMFGNLDPEIKRKLINSNKIIQIVAQRAPDHASRYCGGGRAWLGQVGNPNYHGYAWGISGNVLNCTGSVARYHFATVAHELGHSLGLDHLDDGNLMDTNGGNDNCDAFNNACNFNAGQLDALKKYSPYLGSGNSTPPPTAPTPKPTPTPPPAATGRAPIGTLDTVNCSVIRGWTFDQDEPNKAITVHVYIENNGANAGFNAGPTGEYRTDVNRNYGISGNHGFNFALPAQYRDGRPHRVTVYGLDSAGKPTNWAAGGSVTCAAPAAARSPIGHFDSVSCDNVQGWAFDPDEPSRAIEVHMYIENNGQYAGYNTGATSISRSDVNRDHGISGTHGFKVNIPSQFRDGRPHRIIMYGINVGGNASHWSMTRDMPACGGSSNPSPSPISGVKTIRGVASNRCVDVPGANFNNDVPMNLYDCNGGNAQRWDFKPNKTIQTQNGKCLDVFNGPGNNARVIIWSCHGGPNQQWEVTSNGLLRSLQSGRCLDAAGAGTGNGTPLVIYDCHGQNNQRWDIK